MTVTLFVGVGEAAAVDVTVGVAVGVCVDMGVGVDGTGVLLPGVACTPGVVVTAIVGDVPGVVDDDDDVPCVVEEGKLVTGTRVIGRVNCRPVALSRTTME